MKRRPMWCLGTLIVGCAAAAGIGLVAADPLSAPEGVPRLIAYEGSLLQAGVPVSDGPHDMWFRLFTVPSGGTPFWQLSQRSVRTTDGRFSITLGDTSDGQTAISANDAAGGDLYLEVAVGTSAEVVGRQRVVSVPYALRAARASGSDTASRASELDGSTSLALNHCFAAPPVVVPQGGSATLSNSTFSFSLSRRSRVLVTARGGRVNVASASGAIADFIIDAAVDGSRPPVPDGALMTVTDNSSFENWNSSWAWTLEAGDHTVRVDVRNFAGWDLTVGSAGCISLITVPVGP